MHRLAAKRAGQGRGDGGRSPADFELERDRAEHLVAKKLLKATADTMTAGQATPRLEGALAAPKARPWWRRIVE